MPLPQYFQRARKPVQCGHMESSEGNHYLAMRARGIEERLQENGRHRVQQASELPYGRILCFEWMLTRSRRQRMRHHQITGSSVSSMQPLPECP